MKRMKMKSREELPALFVNVSTDPSIKVRPILDLGAVVYSSVVSVPPNAF